MIFLFLLFSILFSIFWGVFVYIVLCVCFNTLYLVLFFISNFYFAISRKNLFQFLLCKIYLEYICTLLSTF